MYSVTVEQMRKELGLELLTPEINLEKRKITDCDVNRPALQLAGYFDYFDPTRLQIIGKVEHGYLSKMKVSERSKRIKRLMEYKDIPCIVICRKELEPFPCAIEYAIENQIPLLRSHLSASSFSAEVNRWLHKELAPRVSMHGVLVDIFGEGVLILGDSGIGKSETALELIKRGHRLVADDAVEIKKISEKMLIGSAPEVIRHFIEVRGIGIVDIKQIFGVGAVKKGKNIDMVIKLEPWDQSKQYDRLGIISEYTDILGIPVVTNSIPIRPGRNIAIICETAAINYRQKKMGYNAGEALNERVMMHLEKLKDQKDIESMD